MGVAHLLPCISGLSVLINCSLQPWPPWLILPTCHMTGSHGLLHEEAS